MKSNIGPSSRSQYATFLEACYAGSDDDHQVWSAGLLQGLRPLLDHGYGVGFSLIQEHNETDRQHLLLEAVGPMAEAFRSAQDVAQKSSAEAFKLFYHPPHLVLRASPLARRAHAPREVGETIRTENVDMVGLLGYPSAGLVFVAAAPLDMGLRLSSAKRDELHRIRSHVEAAVRLRFASAGQIKAVIAPNGKVLHAQPDATGKGSRELVSRSVARVERARSKGSATTAEDPLVAWTALVSGVWSLVEKIDRDGKRLYYAMENPPHSRQHRALSSLEARICTLCAKGLLGKHIAYDLGISETKVASCLANAALKLGVANRSQLVALASGLLPEPPAAVTTAALTAAEQEVLAFLLQGQSNLAIARARGTAERTIANQVASILRKTNASSRRSLASKRLSHD